MTAATGEQPSGVGAATQPDYGIFLDLHGKDVLVVGGGPVAARRALGLLQHGARVHVVAPQVCEDLASLESEVHLSRRPFTESDCDGVWLIQTCTGDAQTDALVQTLADERRIWCVRAGAAQESSAWTGTTLAAPDGVLVTVNGGRDPGRARRVRDQVRACLDRTDLRRTRGGRGAGHVSLIGGGPGDPELITVRGHRLLRAADVILYDRLAPVALIEELDHAEGPLLVDVGKTPGNHPMPQTEINDLIVSHALAGRRVARLKGGDPFVFGRGTEEALSALEHGLPVEVVPGITAGLAVPAAAGVPVTSRGQARAVLLLSGHDGAESVVARTHGTPADTTLVLYMGVRHLREVATALIEAGRPADLPVAVISSGLTHSQRTVVGTLATIADAAADQRAPAITVIGEVAALSEELGTLVPPSADARHAH
ncbi:MAG: uroporphyrinogen-III C-methyltransferase [Actinobacteria bacterium]|nr:uroporphyrinogen-III C-methyltransferase [Actinomycetota bacterium]